MNKYLEKISYTIGNIGVGAITGVAAAAHTSKDEDGNPKKHQGLRRTAKGVAGLVGGTLGSAYLMDGARTVARKLKK